MVTVHELLQALPDITIYAGRSGLDKPINTISFLDAPSSVDWLNGGEVILTTAFLYKENTDIQFRFVSKLIEMGVVALGIKIGRYIDQIPDAIIDLADANHFPIFGIGYDTVWSEIFAVFYNLALDKKNDRSILSTEIITFDKLFRSSTWDSHLIRSHFLKCIGVPAVIVNDDYKILSKNNGKAVDAIEAYCKKRVRYRSGTDTPDLFITQEKQMRKIFDLSLFDGERLILCSSNGDIVENELYWIKTLYESIHKKNRFMLDTPSLWKNFIKECLAGSSDENLVDYIQVLKLKEDRVSTIIVFDGEQMNQVTDDFRKPLRTGIKQHEVEIHDAMMDSGEIVMLYSKTIRTGMYEFIGELRVALLESLLLYPKCRIWVGEPVERLQNLRVSYNSAIRARELGTHLLPNETLIFYRDVCIFDQLHEDGYDYSEITYLNSRISSFDACRTLEIFLECGNIKRAAEFSFIHDNAMRYRIHKIEQILQLDLSKSINRLNMLLKLKLWRIANVVKK